MCFKRQQLHRLKFIYILVLYVFIYIYMTIAMLFSRFKGIQGLFDIFGSFLRRRQSMEIFWSQLGQGPRGCMWVLYLDSPESNHLLLCHDPQFGQLHDILLRFKLLFLLAEPNEKNFLRQRHFALSLTHHFCRTPHCSLKIMSWNLPHVSVFSAYSQDSRLIMIHSVLKYLPPLIPYVYTICACMFSWVQVLYRTS